MVISTIQRDTKIMECSICLQVVDIEDNADLECGHPFHIECVKQMHDTLCPSCRAYMKSDKLSDEDLHRMESRHSKDIREADEQDFIQMNIPYTSVRRIVSNPRNHDALREKVREYNDLRDEIFKVADVNLYRDERLINYIACKLEESLGIEIGYVPPHDLERAKRIHFMYLNELEKDEIRIRCEIEELQRI